MLYDQAIKQKKGPFLGLLEDLENISHMNQKAVIIAMKFSYKVELGKKSKLTNKLKIICINAHI